MAERTVKTSRRKALLTVLICGAIIFLLIMARSIFLPGTEFDLSTSEGREAYLNSLGWEIKPDKPEPKVEAKVEKPKQEEPKQEKPKQEEPKAAEPKVETKSQVKQEKVVVDWNKFYEDMTIEELQEAILEKMRKNGPVTDYMLGTVRENTHHDSLVTWVRSFN